MKNAVLNTGVDSAYKLILMNGRMTMKDLADAMKVEQKHVEIWTKMLSKKKLVKVRYPFIGKPVVMSLNYDDDFKPYSERHPVEMHNQEMDAAVEAKPTNRVLVKDWVVECPKGNGHPVMFNKDCMSCPHFSTVSGSTFRKKDPLNIDAPDKHEFNMRGVMCMYKKPAKGKE